VGGGSLVLFAAGLVFRLPELAAWGLAFFGAEYGLFLGFRGGAVDRWAPLVAAVALIAAESGFRAIEPPEPAPERAVVVRAIVWLVAGALATAAVGTVLLAAAGGGRTSLGLEAVGAAAAVATVGLLVGLAWRAAR
jgi:hypothetical protein